MDKQSTKITIIHTADYVELVYYLNRFQVVDPSATNFYALNILISFPKQLRLPLFYDILYYIFHVDL